MSMQVSVSHHRPSDVGRELPAGAARSFLIGIVCLAALTAALGKDPAAEASAVAQAGADLTHLLRAMAAIKALMAVCLSAAVVWRLGVPIGAVRWAAYAAAGAAMAAGPPLIWAMVHPGFGALLLHGGLVATIVLFWRDQAVGARFGQMLALRNQRGLSRD